MREDALSFEDGTKQCPTYSPTLRQRLLAAAVREHPALSRLWKCAWHVRWHQKDSWPHGQEDRPTQVLHWGDNH
ncbi:hypothetical protein DPMN_073032 [Dreissena polymorpha]|uniref:Uncharacterized protein n=1 Tax=Dreissena polymorpha TaxID=45954 RepID=A0A9D4BYE5_DREPO|nr:hypothetical protein DPMN_073032 [Dreissena polymorpha]